MLTQIRPAAASLAEVLERGSEEGALELLLGCHARIRHFTQVALALSREDAPAGEVAAAAAAVHRYYSVALPLHEADENESVYPRLRWALPAGELAEANQAMVDQHRAIDALIAELLPLWAGLMEPAAAAARVTTQAPAQRLQELWQTHLDLEEQVVFPALRSWLTAEDLGAIRGEMIARRRVA